MSEPLYGFRGSLKVDHLDNGEWRLLEPLTYLCKRTQKAYTVEAGEQTDFASVPRLPIIYLLFGGRATKAAVIHDHLYRTGQEPKEIADLVFAEAMGFIGVPDWVAKSMYAGVAIGAPDYELQEDGTVVYKPAIAMPDYRPRED